MVVVCTHVEGQFSSSAKSALEPCGLGIRSFSHDMDPLFIFPFAESFGMGEGY